MSADPGTSPEADRVRAAQAAIASADPRIALRLNRNRRLLLSLRYHRDGGGTLSLHQDLLDHQEVLAELPAWIRGRGRGRFPGIRAGLLAVARIQGDRHGGGPALPAGIEPIGRAFDLDACLATVHGRWFPHLDRPPVAWARNARLGTQAHIRFGCYRRSPAPHISVHPRLRQPWVARVFVEHVLFHELCHHAQARKPVRGEPMHSERFRGWERIYPHHDLAQAWERAFLHHLLAGTAPPTGG